MPSRRRRPFVELAPSELSVLRAGEPVLFLDRFDGPALRRELAGAGVLQGLAERGYPDVVLRTDLVAGEHRLRVAPRQGKAGLVELRVAEAGRLVDEPPLRQGGLEILSFLAVHWLALQDPRARFTRERPRLPGQRYPGLGLGRRLYALLLGWAASWGKDGLLAFPEYFHNAWLYAAPRQRAGAEGPPLPPFRFLSPERQGLFEALARDFAHQPLAAASAALAAGRVREAGSGEPVRWEAAELVVPLTTGLRAYLDSRDYRRAADAARDAVRFTLA
jgi:hypothetical protein